VWALVGSDAAALATQTGRVLTLPTAVDLTAVVVGALSGATIAARQHMAVTGVLVMAFGTGLGGGLIRDVLLARGTPVALTSHLYLPTVTITAAVAFFFAETLSRLTPILLGLDALSLGLFTVIGAEKAQLAHLPFGSVIFFGVVTAVGGSVIRDVFLNEPLDIMQPGPINALAALIGASVLALLAGPLDAPRVLTETVTIAVTFALRLLALVRRWQAPVALDLSERLGELGLVERLKRGARRGSALSSIRRRRPGRAARSDEPEGGP
jgi:uncharacterized membrane protein YeiH